MEMGTRIGSRLYIGFETSRVNTIDGIVCGRTLKRGWIPRWCHQCCARLWCNCWSCNCNASRHSKSCIHWINRSGPINCRTCGQIEFEKSLTRTWRCEQNLDLKKKKNCAHVKISICLGKSPLVVMPDVDIDEAVEVAHNAIFGNRKFHTHIFCTIDVMTWFYFLTILHCLSILQMVNAAAPVAEPLYTRKSMMVKRFFFWYLNKRHQTPFRKVQISILNSKITVSIRRICCQISCIGTQT